jgi:hypothetical protein
MNESPERLGRFVEASCKSMSRRCDGLGRSPRISENPARAVKGCGGFAEIPLAKGGLSSSPDLRTGLGSWPSQESWRSAPLARHLPVTRGTNRWVAANGLMSRETAQDMGAVSTSDCSIELAHPTNTRRSYGYNVRYVRLNREVGTGWGSGGGNWGLWYRTRRIERRLTTRLRRRSS